MPRIMGLDVGEVRIGVAVSDPLGFFAQGIAVLSRRSEWLERLAELVELYDVSKIVVGLPVRTSGLEGVEARRMRKVVKLLRSRFPELEVEVWDERFTTTIAERSLLEGDVSRLDRRKKIDKVAASVMLQSFLDAEREGL